MPPMWPPQRSFGASYREEFQDADWDHMHVRSLIDATLVMAGQKPIGTDDGLYAPASPPEIDPALAVAIRYLDAEKAYGKALDRRAHEETVGARGL
jgi:hypothetical protein